MKAFNLAALIAAALPFAAASPTPCGNDPGKYYPHCGGDPATSSAPTGVTCDDYPYGCWISSVIYGGSSTATDAYVTSTASSVASNGNSGPLTEYGSASGSPSSMDALVTSTYSSAEGNGTPTPSSLSSAESGASVSTVVSDGPVPSFTLAPSSASDFCPTRITVTQTAPSIIDAILSTAVPSGNVTASTSVTPTLSDPSSAPSGNAPTDPSSAPSGNAPTDPSVTPPATITSTPAGNSTTVSTSTVGVDPSSVSGSASESYVTGYSSQDSFVPTTLSTVTTSAPSACDPGHVNGTVGNGTSGNCPSMTKGSPEPSYTGPLSNGAAGGIVGLNGGLAAVFVAMALAL